MGRLPGGTLVWSLRRYTRDVNLWDRTCFRGKHTTPSFEHEHRSQEGRWAFNYLCDVCVQKKLAEWLQCEGSPDFVFLGYLTDFDSASVYYEEKNEGETLTLTRWSPEQRRRRLQVDE